MSDGGISGAPAGSAPAPAPAPSAPGLTEEQARDVLNGMVDERLNARGLDGLDRLHARMDEVSGSQRAWADSLAGQGLYAPEDDADYDGDEPDVLDHVEAMLADAVDRRFDAEEVAEQGELSLAEREHNFDELRARLPMLQHEPTALAVAHRAYDLCHAWEANGLLDSAEDFIASPGFVDVLEKVALSAYADPAILERPAPAPSNGNGYSGTVQLESAAGAGNRQTRPPADQERFMRYVEATEGKRI